MDSDLKLHNEAFDQLITFFEKPAEGKDYSDKIESFRRLKDQMCFGNVDLNHDPCLPTQLRRQHPDFPSGNARLGDSAIVLPPAASQGEARPPVKFGEVAEVGIRNDAGYNLSIKVVTEDGSEYFGFPQTYVHGDRTKPVVIVQPLHDELELFDFDGRLRATADKFGLMIVRHATNRDDPTYSFVKLTDDGVVHVIGLLQHSLESAGLVFNDGLFHNTDWSVEDGEVSLNIPDSEEVLTVDEALPDLEVTY